MTGDRGSPIGSDFANPVLIARHRPENRHRLAATSPRSHTPVHVVGEDDQGVDVKRCAGADSANRIAQRVDIRHQQVRAPIKQVYGKEEGPAWNPIAAIIRHLKSMQGRRERRKALRRSALRLLIETCAIPHPLGRCACPYNSVLPLCAGSINRRIDLVSDIQSLRFAAGMSTPIGSERLGTVGRAGS